MITACQTTFKPTPCDIVNVDTLECKPTDKSRPFYDISTLDAIGFRCISPEDWREAKRRIRESLEFDKSLNLGEVTE